MCYENFESVFMKKRFRLSRRIKQQNENNDH